jgi:hypothetical protein
VVLLIDKQTTGRIVDHLPNHVCQLPWLILDSFAFGKGLGGKSPFLTLYFQHISIWANSINLFTSNFIFILGCSAAR